MTNHLEPRRAREAQHDLASTVDDYAQYLAERGYAPRTVDLYLPVIAHFARWLTARRASSWSLDEAVLDRFIQLHLPTCRCSGLRSRRSRHVIHAALVHYLAMLRASGRVPPRRPFSNAAITAELNDFDRHLAEVRGLVPATRRVRLRDVRAFLSCLSGHGVHALGRVRPRDVTEFMERYAAGLAPGSIRAFGISLRSYFAFKAIGGADTVALAAAVPRVAQWRLAGLPTVLATEEITRYFGAFDRTRATGKRDYAIARCLSDLGLRRAEVARLQLDDVDWQAGTLSIHGKGRRVDVLPLPATTGRAIIDYLRHGRPVTTRREVFVRHRPPVNAPGGLDIVRNAVRYAAARCGLEHRIRGTHILRHTLATRLVQRGARFKDIADVLRHRSIDTTAIYAKVDLPALSRVALPWPGRRP